MQIFYTEELLEDSTQCELAENEVHHVANVLRLGVGEAITLTNGKGLLGEGSIVVATKKRVTIALQKVLKTPQPAYHNLSLAVGLLKNRDRMEWLAEKATEVGIGKLIWMHTSRSERGKVRLDRMEGVVTAAMKQSLQMWKPAVELAGFQEIMDGAAAGNQQIIMAHEKATESIDLSVDQTVKPTLLLVGPEGGFTPEEVENVVKVGGKSLLISRNRLRTETAALTLLQYYHLRLFSGNSSPDKLMDYFM